MAFLKNRAIPVAIDQAYQRRQKDTEGDFYRKIVQQSPRKDFGNSTTQGLYLAAADGSFLGFTNHRSPDRVLRMLQEGLQRSRVSSTKPLTRESVDRKYNPRLPDGGLIVRVQAKILSGYEEPESEFQRIFQSSVSRDNLWITAEEVKALASGKVTQELGQRIARFHLVDNTRGEPPMWRAEEIVTNEWSIDGDHVSARVELKNADGSRQYTTQILGKIESKDGEITRFDLVALGLFKGEGWYTKGAPKGRFPLAISFSLADGTDIADSIPPQGGRGWIEGYLR